MVIPVLVTVIAAWAMFNPETVSARMGGPGATETHIMLALVIVWTWGIYLSFTYGRRFVSGAAFILSCAIGGTVIGLAIASFLHWLTGADWHG